MAEELLPLLGGELKSLIVLWSKVTEELGDQCRISTARDIEKCLGRVKREGISFLTITLPQYAIDFQKSLDSGFVASTAFAGFSKRGGLPRFLGGFLSRVFSADGRLLDAPDLECIYAVRQITLLLNKVLLDCAPTRVEAAFRKYIECEKEVKQHDKSFPNYRDEFHRISSLLFADVFTRIDFDIFSGNAVPRHGPGSTADRVTANQKYRQTVWTQRLEMVFPALENILPSPSYWREAQRVTYLEPGAEIPVRVITVPKTLKTPRIIAIEPTCMQYVQQALLEMFTREVKQNTILYDFIGFDDQTPNQVLAQRGSLYKDLATLDLSEASDRVSNQHVRELFRDHPWLFRAIDASRSRKADVPGRGVIRLSKYASMGSGTCFPIEAMVFLTCVFIGIQRYLRRPLTKKDVKSFKGRVRVYGDDIIVPVDMVPLVVSTLESFGFKVGAHKSYWNGQFRESCGKEYFAGTDVTIVKVRRLLPKRRADVEELVSTVALRNHFYGYGLFRCARYLDSILERFLDLPYVLPSSPSLGKHSFFGFSVHRISAATHDPRVRGYAVVPRIPIDPLDDLGALLKFFLKRGDEPAYEGHLQRSGRPTRVDIKRRWIRPY